MDHWDEKKSISLLAFLCWGWWGMIGRIGALVLFCEKSRARISGKMRIRSKKEERGGSGKMMRGRVKRRKLWHDNEPNGDNHCAISCILRRANNTRYCTRHPRILPVARKCSTHFAAVHLFHESPLSTDVRGEKSRDRWRKVKKGVKETKLFAGLEILVLLRNRIPRWASFPISRRPNVDWQISEVKSHEHVAVVSWHLTMSDSI